LAQRASVDRTYVGSVERGQRNPTMMIVDRLLAEMDVTWAEFGAALDRAVSAVSESRGAARARRRRGPPAE
jgi:transcriptional regulator with XRE-family HTH domain